MNADERIDSASEINRLSIKAFCWERDSHGLYDYDSRTSVFTKLTLTNSSVLQLDQTDHVSFCSLDVQDSNRKQQLLSIVYLYGSYWAFPPKQISAAPEQTSDHAWLVIKSLLPNEFGFTGYKLSNGDTLKIGRLIFEVMEIETRTAKEIKKKLRNKSERKVIPEKEPANSAANLSPLEETQQPISQYGTEKSR